MATRSAAVNEAEESAKQIIRALPEPCEVGFRGGRLKLDVPDAEPLMVAKARTALDYGRMRKWIAHDGEIYTEKPQGKELKAYIKRWKAEPPVVPEDECGHVIGFVGAAKLRQTATIVRGCADAADPQQLAGFTDRQLAVMLEADGGYASPAGIAARRLCGIEGPKEDTDAQPSPLDSSNSAATDSKS